MNNLTKSEFIENQLYEIPLEWIITVQKLLGNIYSYCNNYSITLPYIHQIKEKYGALRVYHSIQEDWSNENLNEITRMIELTEKLCN